MSATANGTGVEQVRVYRYAQAKRKNNPPTGLAAQGRVTEPPPVRYAYDAHLPPILRFDETGKENLYSKLL